MTKNNKKNITIENRKAYHDYFIEEKLECGISLKGNEVKSIIEGRASLKESWISIDNNELIIKNMHITPWETSNKFDVDEKRDRKLLAHKNEINDFSKKIKLQGYTLIPLKVYYSNKKVKVEIGLAKGKHNYDKRAVEKEKQIKKDINRAFANSQKY